MTFENDSCAASAVRLMNLDRELVSSLVSSHVKDVR